MANQGGYSDKALQALSNGTYGNIRKGQIASFKRQEGRKYVPALKGMSNTVQVQKIQKSTPVSVKTGNEKENVAKLSQQLKKNAKKANPTNLSKKGYPSSRDISYASKPSTKYKNATAGQIKSGATRDTKYDNDFKNFFDYRYGDFSGEVNYDPTTDTQYEAWRDVKKDIMKKYNWTEAEFDKKFKPYEDEQWQKQSDTEVKNSADFSKDNWARGALVNALYMPQAAIEGVLPVLHSVGSGIKNAFLTQGQRAMGVPEAEIQAQLYADKQKENPYVTQKADDPALTATRARAAAKNAAMENMNGVEQAAYQTGTGLADMGESMLFGGAAPFVMAATNAADTQMRALERGVDANQAEDTAAAAGLISAFMNKVGLDAVKGLASNSTNVLPNILKSAAREGLENVAEDTLNLGVDTVINGHQSELNALHDYYVSEGMASDSAWGQVALDKGIDLVKSGLSGAAFGAMVNGAKNFPTLEAFVDSKLADRTFKKNDNVRHILETGEAPVDTTDIDTFIDDTTKQANDAVNEINNLNEQIPEASNSELRAEENSPVGESVNGAEETSVDAIRAKNIPETATHQYLTDDVTNEYLTSGNRRNSNRAKEYEDGKKLVIKSRDELRDFLYGDNTPYAKTVAYGKVSDDLANRVKQASDGKVDIKGYFLEVERCHSDHAKKHEQPTKSGNLPLSKSEVIYALEHINDASIIDVTKNSNGKKVVRLGFDMGDGHIVMVEVASKSRDGLRYDSGWKVDEDTYNRLYGQKKNSPNTVWGNPGGSTPDESVPNQTVNPIGENVNSQEITQPNVNSQKPNAPEMPILSGMEQTVGKIPSDNGISQDIDDDFEMLNDTGLNEPDSYTLEVPLEPGEGFRSPAGIRNTYTNTYINADIISKYEYEHNPKIQEAAKYAVANNEESYNTALNDVKKHGAEFLKGYLDGSREINTHEDVDRSMLLLQNLADQLERGEDVRAQKDLLQSRLAKAATQRGQFIQAFAKWNDTADGALFNGKGIKSARTEQWEGTHQRDVATNKRIAQKLTDNVAEWDGTRISNGANYNPNQNTNPNGTSARMDRALKQQGYDGTMDTTRTPKTHEQHRAEVENSIKKEYGSIASQLTDQDFEFATWMVENNVPVDIIVDELEHRFNHGEWYTIDESTPIKKQVSGKLASILAQMGDDTRKANSKRVPAMDEISYPAKSHATIAEEVRNTLDSDAASLGLDTDTDIEFMTIMLEEGVPRWQIEDEIRHRLATGEWYSLDESIPEPKAKNQNIRSALNALVNSGETQAKPELTREELREQIRNTLDDEHASLGEFTDEDVDYLANLIENGATTQELADALNTKLATGAFDISLDTQKKVNLLFEEASRYDPNSQEACVAKAAAYKLIADEVMGDASALEKFEAWRYVAMLGNPKTMLRNFVGNTMFNALTSTSNSFAGLVEAATDASVKAGKKASNKLFKTEFDTTKGIERRKSVLLPTTKDRGLVKSAWKDATAHRYNDITGTKYEKGVKDKIREQKSVFNSKWVQLYEKLTDAGISDTFAVRTKYSTSLAGYLKANGFDESIFDADERYRGLQEISRRRNLTDTERAQMAEDQKLHDVLEKARDYAVAQAEYATFHEDNKFASWLSKASREAPKPVQWLIEGTTPFKKTPANIVRSAEEFSPFGAINSIIKTGKLIYENTGKRKGQLADTYTTKSGKVRQKTLASDVIESWSKTLTGSALMGLGYYLSNKGILNSSEKDEQYQDELEGKQNYSITINGHTYTIDWAAPAAMTLLMGAELNKIVKRNGILDKTIYDNLSDVIGVVNTLLDPIVETSMMQGVKDTLQSAADITRYNDAADAGLGIIGTVSANAATNYLTQAVPTVLGQMARVIDPTRRSTDTVAKDSLVAGMEKQGRKLMNRLPFVSMLNTPYVNARGQEQLNSPSANPLISIPYQFLSPGYLSEIKETEADKSARDVYNAKIPYEDEEGNKKLIPQMDKGVFETWKSKVTVGDHKFTPKEMYQYRTSSGQANEEIRTALANEDWFNGLDPQMQNDLLKKVNSLVDKIGLEAVGYPQDDKALDEYNSGGVPSLLDHYKQSSIKKQVQEETGLSSQSKKTTEITNAIMEGKTEEANQMIAEEVQKQEAVKPYQEPAEALGIDAQDYSYVKSYAGSSWSKVEPELPKLKELGGTNYSQYAHAVNYADSHGESISAQQFYDQTKRLDTDKSGGVSQDELINEFNAKGMKEAEVMRLWGMLALGKDGAEPKSVPHIITRGKNKGKWGR